MDWPDSEGPIDLGVHDLPHASSSTEWWYLNSRLTTEDGRNLALFASFFRVVKGRDETTKKTLYAHSLTWALVDLDDKRYFPDSMVDSDAPEMGLERLKRGDGSKDPRMRSALREILERGNVPYPDHMFEAAPYVHLKKLELDYDGNRLVKLDDGSYQLSLYHAYYKCGVELVFNPQKPPIRHGDNGVVQGHDGGHMFYYFIPRNIVTGTVLLDGRKTNVADGSGWYDHEFGGLMDADDDPNENIAWNWVSLQLDDGSDVTAYHIVDLETGEDLLKHAILVGPKGERRAINGMSFEPLNIWHSTRSFNTYPTKWRLTIPDFNLDMEVEAAFEDQEFITLISKPAFWEGHCEGLGTVDGRPTKGRGWIERSGFTVNDTLDDFFRAVGQEVRKSVAALIPFDPTYEQVRNLIASEERDHYMEGVDTDVFVRIGVKPVRDITDRGGKGWRSYAALACCDVVGGDSRDFVHWLAMPELMHVGSLIVDDVQDKSTIRRGGPTCHEVHGEALAINAGTSAYFMGQRLLQGTQVSNAEKLRLYDLYFEALRAGHAGQAYDIDGVDAFVPHAVETGDVAVLEQKVLAIHRLKTAAPAGALSRMGAIVGGGTEEQVEGLGRYFEALGVAFQIVDDVLNLRGFKNDLKMKGEDIAHGKVTLPVAKAFARLDDRADRAWVWEQVQSKPQDPADIAKVIAKLESCGAVEACSEEARERIEAAWLAVEPLLEDSIVKLMLRAFGGYVLERHY